MEEIEDTFFPSSKDARTIFFVSGESITVSKSIMSVITCAMLKIGTPEYVNLVLLNHEKDREIPFLVIHLDNITHITK